MIFLTLLPGCQGPGVSLCDQDCMHPLPPPQATLCTSRSKSLVCLMSPVSRRWAGVCAGVWAHRYVYSFFSSALLLISFLPFFRSYPHSCPGACCLCLGPISLYSYSCLGEGCLSHFWLEASPLLDSAWRLGPQNPAWCPLAWDQVHSPRRFPILAHWNQHHYPRV